MSGKIQAEIQKVSLYVLDTCAYLHGHDLYGMKMMRPRKVFVAFPLVSYLKIGGRRPRYSVGWHASLEELTVRFDVESEDKEKLKTKGIVKREIIKEGGGVSNL